MFKANNEDTRTSSLRRSGVFIFDLNTFPTVLQYFCSCFELANVY